MKKITLFLIFTLFSAICFAADYKSSDIQYKTLQSAYTKEANIYFTYKYIITKYPSAQGLEEVLTRHNHNLKSITKVLDLYGIPVPDHVLKSNDDIDISDRDHVCENGVLLEKELSVFYHDAVSDLQKLKAKDDHTGNIIELFKFLEDSSDKDNARFFKTCSTGR